MWKKIRALPLGVKIIALLFVTFGGILSYASNARSGPDYSPRDVSTPTPGPVESSVPASPDALSSDDRSKLLAQLEEQHNVLQSRNIACSAQINQNLLMMSPATAPCEAQMQIDIVQMAQLEAEIYRLKTGANVHTGDFLIVGSSSSSGGGAKPSEGPDPIGRYDREHIRGQSNYTDSDDHKYELSTDHSHYFRNRASGEIVGSDQSQPPDYQHDWEELKYQPN